MKAEELRIGNYVDVYKCDVHYGIEVVNNISSMGINERLHGQYCAVFEYPMNDELLVTPIPLTEEWLLRFGFESDNYELHETYLIDISRPERYDHDSYLKILVMDDDCYVDISEKEIHPDTIENNVNLKKIKHIHQLQNLYYALTGEELKLKS